jgi:hypothetical protein
MRRNLGFSSVVGFGWMLFSIACSSTPKPPAPCTDAAGCAAGQYCAAGVCTPKIAAGSPCVVGTGHTANDLCSSSICAGAFCCTAACASTDQACASTACDATGACLYPDAGTTCGAAPACNGANFDPASKCNGAGGCTASTPVSCSPYLCANGGCAKTCRGTTECNAGFYCSSGVCVTREDAGANCNGTSTSSPGEACDSNVCIANHCCADACSNTDLICHVNACDTSGACLYPGSATGCGPLETCVAGMHTPPSGCGGDGGCVISAAVPCGLYTCDSVGRACYTSCNVGDDSFCTTGNYCAAGACKAQLATGNPCLANDACVSSICQGNCCSAACAPDVASNCQGSCDTTGACGHPTCAVGYGCGGSPTCNTTCASDLDCAPGGYTCSNPVNGSCCLPPVAGGIIYVDGKLGADTNCCDSPSTACMTLTHAMKLVVAASATGTRLNVAWNGNPAVRADWAPATAETYPIHLGMGVTVYAPGIFFTPDAPTPPKQGNDVFEVFAYNAADTGRVTIEGDPIVDFMYIGFDSTQANLTGTLIAVNSGTPAVPLTLTNVWMNGQTEALNLGSGSNVTVGPNRVIIGSGGNLASPLTGISSPGSGIYCNGAAANRATLTDDSAGMNILQIDSQDNGHQTGAGGGGAQLKALDYCDISLTQSPIFGLPAPCPNKVDGEGILLNNSSTLNLKGATVQCMSDHGISLCDAQNCVSNATHPTLTLDSSTIRNTGCTALKIYDGTVTVTNSTVYHSRYGILQGGASTIDLSGGGNTSACNTNQEPGFCGVGGRAGMDVWNDSTNLMKAANVLFDESPPAVWSCTDVGVANCSCVSGPCNGSSGVAAPDGADVVNDSTGSIDVSDAGLSAIICN